MVRFTCKVEVDTPRKDVVEIFSDPDHFPHFQEGFQRLERIAGEEGHPGAVSHLFYQMRGTEVMLEETILDNSLPELFAARYHHSHMDNTLVSRFSKIDDNTTLYTAEVEYTDFRGFLPKLLSWFYPGFFRKQVQKWMEDFKVYAESLQRA
jgi:hypothetical protein